LASGVRGLNPEAKKAASDDPIARKGHSYPSKAGAKTAELQKAAPFSRCVQ
jgi:hypothetical protein